MPLKYSDDGRLVGCHAESIPDAKMCIKELKLKKKKFQLQKKEVASEIAQIRAEHRSAKTKAGPTVRGSGFLASMTRSIDRATKHTVAVNVDNAVQALENRKTTIDSNITQLDNALLQLERYVLDNTKSSS